MSDPGRRKFLIAAPAAAAAVTLLDGCKKHPADDPYLKSRIKPAVPGSAGLGKGVETHVTTVCGQCPAGCALDVRVVEGRAVSVRGVEDYPVNRGTIGPKGQASPEMLYHRDRIRTPLKRAGGSRAGALVPATWDEAFSAIGGVLKALRERHEARSLVILSGEARGPMRDLWERFAKAYGTPNLVDHRSMTDGAKSLANLAMQGVYELPAIDWDRTSYVLGLGTSHLESWCQTIHMMRAASAGRRGLPGKRVKFVNVSPRFSTTAGKADEWIAIEPGTYGALALGLGHVLVRDKLHDEKFVAERCFGFDDWKGSDGKAHRGFKDVLMKDGEPKAVSEMTGVGVDVIERLAHELAEFRPSVVVADPHATASSNGLSTAMAVHALNALLGNIGRPGGIWEQERAPLAPWTAVAVDDLAKEGNSAPRLDGAFTPAGLLSQSVIHRLPPALLSKKPYAAQAIFLHYSNPAYSKPSGAEWLKALSEVPLVVSFSPLPDESTQAADWVLPDSMPLERWEYVESAPALGSPSVGLRQPAVKPLYDTKQTGDVVVALAKLLGDSVASAFDFESYRAALEVRLEGLAKQVGANTDAEDVEGLIEAMQEKGGWWRKEAKAPRTEFATPSKKFEFYSQRIAEALKAVPSEVLEASLTSASVTARGDDLCLPRREAPRFVGDPAHFPFVLLPYRSIGYAEGGIRHSRRLMSLPLVEGNPWHERVELNPADAAAQGITMGQKVILETEAGSREVYAYVRGTIRPGTLALPLGYGQWPPKPGELSAYSLLAPAAEDVLAGIYALNGTRARVRRAS